MTSYIITFNLQSVMNESPDFAKDTSSSLIAPPISLLSCPGIRKFRKGDLRKFGCEEFSGQKKENGGDKEAESRRITVSVECF